MTQEQNFEKLISEAKNLPCEANEAALTRIKKFADNVIHGGDYRRTRKILQNKKKFEIEVNTAFRVVRVLIEASPT